MTFDPDHHRPPCAMASEDEKAVPLLEEKEKPGGRKEVDIPDCPVHSVVVYPDRAEVSREVVQSVV